MGLVSYLRGLVAVLPVVHAAVLKCREHPGLEVTFKEVSYLLCSATLSPVLATYADRDQTRICETTPGVKGYAGYVTLPPTLDPEAANYTSHMFFWFFEARSNPATAPLTVWLQGGPGDASVDQAVSGHNGPCAVQADSRTTKLNPNSWNAKSNLLYIDQPALTGFTYDDIVPGVLNTITWEIDVSPEGQNVPLNWTAIRGKFNTQNEAHAAHSTSLAARALVGFLDLWTKECVESAVPLACTANPGSDSSSIDEMMSTSGPNPST